MSNILTIVKSHKYSVLILLLYKSIVIINNILLLKLRKIVIFKFISLKLTV